MRLPRLRLRTGWLLAAIAVVLLATPALAQVPGESKGPSVAIFLSQLLLLVLVGRLLGEAMLRIKQPAVMGQLVAGLILGPSLLGALFGLSPDMALALSLLKRGRDITIGVPVLLCWQALEGGALMRRRAATDTDNTP